MIVYLEVAVNNIKAVTICEPVDELAHIFACLSLGQSPYFV